MRHRCFGRKLNRDVKERKALYRSLITSLIEKEKIKTTLAKAKAIQGLIEKTVTLAKDNSVSAARHIASILAKKGTIEKMTKDIAPRFKDRAGGFIRIRKLGKRFGDSTEEATIEWTVLREKKENKEKLLVKKDKAVRKKEVTEKTTENKK